MRGEKQLALTPPTPPTVFCPDPVFPCVPEALGSLPGAPFLLVPGRFTPSIQHLPVATRGSTSVLLRSSWGQSHFSPWGHRRASASLHAGIGRAVPRVAGGGASPYGRALKWFSVQVVHMAGLELRALLEESEASVSPLLCLSQSGPRSFLQPVTVQLPLPPGVTGEAACHRTKDGCLEGETAFRGALAFCHFLSRLQSEPLPPASALPNTPDNHLG